MNSNSTLQPLVKTRRRRPPFVLIVLTAIVGVAVLLPLFYLIVRSTGASGGIWAYLFRPRTLAVLGNTLLLVSSVSVASVAVALPIAFLTTRTRIRARRLWFVLAVLPLVIPSYVGAYAYVSAFAKGGLISGWLGIKLPVYGFWGALIVLTLSTYPYLLLTLRAGFLGIDTGVEEASRSLGRSSLTTFLRVTLPLLRPALAAGVLLVALYVLSDFGAVSMLRYNTFTRAIYIQYENSFNLGNAAALGLMLILLAGAIILVDSRLRGLGRIGRTGVGEARAPRYHQLGPWYIPALAMLSGTVVLGLVAPVAIIVTWLIRGFAADQPLVFDMSALVNAGGIALVAAAVVVVAAIPVAVLAVRFPSKLSAFLERLTYVSYALPGIVVALSLVFFALRFVPWAYQSYALLVFAYALLFLPQAVGNLRATLLQVNIHLEEAALGLGRSPIRVLFDVTLPLVRTGLVTSAVLVFLTTMKELPATLLLRPTGFETLATRVWSWTEEAFFAQAAPFALLLVIVSSISVAILLSQEQ